MTPRNSAVKASVYLLLLSAAAAQPVVQLDAYGRDSVRVRIAPAGGAIVDTPFSPLVPPPASLQDVQLSADGLSITAGNLAVTADAATGFVTATRVSDGAQLFSTSALVFGPAAPGSKPSSVSASLVISVAGGGANSLFGLGEHETGKLDMTNYSKTFQQSQYYGQSHGADILLPFYMAHPLGLGLLWALPSYGSVSLQPTAHNWTSIATPQIDLWVTTTPAPTASDSQGASDSQLSLPVDPAATGPMAEMLHNYVDAVGHAAPMPSYVAGFWQCKNRYRTQQQVLDVARGYRNRSLPLDIITIDYMHWQEWGDWSFRPDCFPDPQGMVQELTDMGVELAVTFWPYLCAEGAHFANFSASGFFANALGTSNPAAVESWACQMFLTDETNPAARRAIYDAFRSGYGQYGIRTVWLDGSEPERSTSFNYGQFSLAGGSDNEVGESWVLQHVRAMAEGFAGDGFAPDEFFLLPRSTWSGAHRYSAGVWSGDISSDFATLENQIVIAQSMGLSGHALWTNDGGGYAGGNPDDPTFQELIVRWLQASAFFPIMRLHGQRAGGPPDDACGNTGGDNEIWTLAKDQAHYDALAAILQMRASLRDYTLKINRVTVSTGLPMVRSMLLAYPDDPNCTVAVSPDIEKQWMFGPDYVVKPVLAVNTTSISVYLPSIAAYNLTWVYFWNQTDVGPGGGYVTVDTTSIADFGLFVRTPAVPPPQRLTVASLWSASRNDSVTCASALCYADQQPNGAYVAFNNEGVTYDSAGPVRIGGTSYTLVPLTNYWSTSLLDNADSVNGPPDASYDVPVDNAFVFATQAPGTIPLTLYFKNYSSTHVDTAAFASSASMVWAEQNGYAASGVVGFIFPF